MRDKPVSVGPAQQRLSWQANEHAGLDLYREPTLSCGIRFLPNDALVS